jgi:hypothetical protein
LLQPVQALDRQKGMFVHGEAMVEIAHHQRVDKIQFRQEQSQKPQRMHGPQRVGGVGLQERLLQVEPEFRAPGRHGCEGRKRLFDAVFGGRAQLHAVVGHEMEQPQQDFRILQRRRLL